MNFPFYSAEDVFSAVSMNEAINAMKDAFLSVSSGKAIIPNRINLPIKDKNAHHLSMPAYIKGGDYISIKLINVHSNNSKLNLPLINGVIVVMDAHEGRPIALIDGASVTALRTGAASGLATDFLANKNIKKAVIIGTGLQAEYQIKAIREVRDFQSIKVIATSDSKSISFCKNFDSTVEPGQKLDLKDAELICTATTSMIPLFEVDDISPGVHINAVGAHGPSKREISTDTLLAGNLYVDYLKPSKEEAGNIIIPINEGNYKWADIKGELGDVINNNLLGRTNHSDITIFSSIGNAAQDLLIVEKLMNIKKNE